MATKPILYDQFNRPIERAVLTQEIAAPSISGVRSPLTGYPGDGLNPRRIASLLREADQGEPLRYFELAEQIEERNPHYAGVLGTRKRSVAQLEIQVDAASDDAEDVATADMIRDWLARDELEDELFDILDAVGKGVSYTEIIWDTSEGQWRPGRLEWRDPRWFRCDRVDGKTPLLRNDGGDIALPPMKFIQATIRAKSGLPVRSGLSRLAAWNWMFKAFTERDWAIFTQTYGQPIRVGKYGPGASEADKDTLLRAVTNIAGDCAAIVPESMLIEFVESKNVTAGSDLYLKRVDYLDRQMSKAVLGQTSTTDAVVGGLGSGKEHREVQEDIERADAKAMSAVLNRDLVRPWVQLEKGPQKKYPRLRIGRAEERDVKTTVEAIEKLVPLGLEVEVSWARDMLGIPDPDKGAKERGLLLAPRAAPAPIAAPPAPGAAPALQASSRPAQLAADEIDALAAAAETVAQPAADAMINAVRDVINKAGSLEELQTELRKLKPDLPTDQFADFLRLAMVMADLSGRADISGSAGA